MIPAPRVRTVLPRVIRWDPPLRPFVHPTRLRARIRWELSCSSKRMHDGKKRVLVIDDDPHVRLLVQTLLEAEGFDVRPAADGREGLELQEGEPADVVV